MTFFLLDGLDPMGSAFEPMGELGAEGAKRSDLMFRKDSLRR